MAKPVILSVVSALSMLSACSERQSPIVTLMLSDNIVQLDREFAATISVADENRELCLYTLPQESFYWVSLSMVERLSPPFILPNRHSEIECRDPGVPYTYEVSLLLSEARGRYLLSMNGEEIGEFDAQEIELGVAVHPANEPSGSSYDGYTNWPPEVLTVATSASEPQR